MEKQIPQTKEECFAQLDAMLSDEDKRALLETENLFVFHFSLGSWIRNNWLYGLSGEKKLAFMRLFVDKDEYPYDDFLPIHPDDYSSAIIEQYVEYLKNHEETK